MTTSSWQNLAKHKADEILEEVSSSFPLKAPVPITDIMEEYVGDVQIVISTDYAFPDSVSALCKKDMDVGWLILVNGKEPSVRQRFSIAHELAHIALFTYQPNTMYCSHNVNDWMEDVCDQFAGHILMPESLVREYYQSISRPQLWEIATAFKVSRVVAQIELQYLGLPFTT